MAEIRAGYRRVFQVRPYETETVELSIVDEVEVLDAPGTVAEKLAVTVRDLHAALAEVGDAVVLDRMGRAPKTPPDVQTLVSGGDPWALARAGCIAPST